MSETITPLHRPRRMRRNTAIRQLVQENFFDLNDLILFLRSQAVISCRFFPIR